MCRFRIGPALALCFFFLVAMPALAQESGAQQAPPIPVRVSQVSQLPGIDQFTNATPDITLVPRGEGARNGHLWIRTWPDGLFIAGKVDGGPPDFPYTKDQILSKDHVEVWLAGAPDVELPPIGWGNQMEDVTLPNGAESCEDWAADWDKQHSSPPPQAVDPVKECREWAAAQVHYRSYFKRLFLRQWLLTPDHEVESFATPAYEEIRRWFSGPGDGIAELMKPQRNANMLFHPDPSGYSFAVYIQLHEFPPLPALSVSELYLLVDVFKAAPTGKKMGVYSTSSPARVWGKAGTFNLLRLDPPLSFTLSPCRLPLVGTDRRRVDHPAWLVPDPEPGHSYVSDTFIVVNDPAGYRYDPAGLSPSIMTTHYFWKNIGKDEWVCGPEMTYTKGGRSYGSSDTISEDGLATRRLPDGTLLIKAGPTVRFSEFRSGECGACPISDLRIFDVGKDMIPYKALVLGDQVGHRIVSQDFTVSPDWSHITEYEQTVDHPGSWTSTTWCLKANQGIERAGEYVYEKCSEKENVQPANPPVLKELRQRDEELPGAQTPLQPTESVTPAKANRAAGVASGVPVGVPEGQSPGGEISTATGPPPPSSLEAAHPNRLRVNAQVQSAKLIFQPQPEYPPLARTARIQGQVRFKAIINKDGTVQDLKVISGHPLLDKAAFDAAWRWRYQPTLLNNEPVEVATEIDVNFALPQ